MSLDAGGLAQMTFNNNNNFHGGGGAIGVPNAGFASRGKGSQLKRLSVSTTNEFMPESNATPRTSRGHLLAGLRTAPRGQAPPASAPYNRPQHPQGPAGPRFAQMSHGMGQTMPQTAIGSSFQMRNGNQFGMANSQHNYSAQDQVLAPPSLLVDAEDEQIDPAIMAQLLQTEAYLAERQKMLQQQLLNLTSQQFQAMNMNGQTQQMRQAGQYFPNAPMTPQMSMLGQQQQLQPTVQEVAGHPGLYMVFNPVTGEYGYVMDNGGQQQHAGLSNSPPPATPSYTNSPPRMETPAHYAKRSSPTESPFPSRNTSPPKKSPSPPQDVQPLPPPSANAFRPGQKLNRSIGADKKGSPAPDGMRSINRPAGVPQTPVTGTFGPGQNRAGEHPIRQPRGPPQLEELIAKPTSKHEGSKNFVARQRRSAVSSLVRKGLERRCVRTGSGDSLTASSEPDNAYYVASDDSDSVQSNASQSRKISVGTIRSHASGVIGSERKARKDYGSGHGNVNDHRSKSSGDSREFNRSTSIFGSDSILEEPPKTSTPGAADRMKTPLLVLTKAEKRKTSVF